MAKSKQPKDAAESFEPTHMIVIHTSSPDGKGRRMTHIPVMIVGDNTIFTFREWCDLGVREWTLAKSGGLRFQGRVLRCDWYALETIKPTMPNFGEV